MRHISHRTTSSLMTMIFIQGDIFLGSMRVNAFAPLDVSLMICFPECRVVALECSCISQRANLKKVRY